jgi:hypothetical protein
LCPWDRPQPKGALSERLRLPLFLTRAFLSAPRRCYFPILAVKGTNLKRREIDVVQAAGVDHPSLWREARPVKRMDPAVSTEVVCRGPGVELVGGQRLLAREDSELFYLRRLVECPLSLTQRAVTLGDRLDLSLNLKRNAPAMTGPSVCRHNLLPTSDARLTCWNHSFSARPILIRGSPCNFREWVRLGKKP